MALSLGDSIDVLGTPSVSRRRLRVALGKGQTL